MTEILEFEKEENKWYVVLPEWTGEKRELQMVAGADTLCDILAKGQKRFKVKAETRHNPGADYYLKRKLVAYGSFYKATDGNTGESATVWLCPVTKYIFGNYPKSLTIKLL